MFPTGFYFNLICFCFDKILVENIKVYNIIESVPVVTSTCCVMFEGESNIEKIQQNVHSAIGGNMSLFCLGFGEDVQYSFLDVMARQNKGLARRIFEGSDAALQLQVEKIDMKDAVR